MQIKQIETVSKEIGGTKFYIRLFGGMTAAKISGDLGKYLIPMIVSVLSGIEANGDGKIDDLLNKDLSELSGGVGDAFDRLDGDTVLKLIKELLIKYENVTFDDEITGNAKILTSDDADELFCGSVFDIYRLCWEVIKLNYGGLFASLGAQSGKVKDLVASKLNLK